MRRILMAVLPLLLVVIAAGGCDFFRNKERFYTYCDATGCYTCDQNGCNAAGTAPGSACKSNAMCAQGCYCAANGQCTEADTMWSGMLVTQQSNLSVSVDLGKLESSPNWMCFALEEAP